MESGVQTTMNLRSRGGARDPAPFASGYASVGEPPAESARSRCEKSVSNRRFPPCEPVARVLARLESLGFTAGETSQPDYHFASYRYIRKGDPARIGDYPEYRSPEISRTERGFVCESHWHEIKIVHADFDDMGSPDAQGWRAVRVGRRYGFADADFRIVIEPSFQRVSAFAEELA